MKNYYFSLILFLTVCISSVYVNFLTTNEINRYISFFNYFCYLVLFSTASSGGSNPKKIVKPNWKALRRPLFSPPLPKGRGIAGRLQITCLYTRSIPKYPPG